MVTTAASTLGDKAATLGDKDPAACCKPATETGVKAINRPVVQNKNASR